MLTPAFELRQDDDFLVIEIKAPYSKISDAEIYFHEEEFKFYSKPYYLRLNLPGKVVENGLESAKYESDNGTYIVHMPKQTPGEVFTGLDLLTKLLAPSPKAAPARPLIEVLENHSARDDELPEVEDDVDWLVEQTPWTPQDEASLLEASVRKYGFDRQRTGVIARIKEEIPDLVDIVDPEHKTVQEARQERLRAEEDRFSAEHYLADRYEPAGVEQVLSYQAHWWDLAVHLDGSGDPATNEDLFRFTEEEKTKMRKLPRREYLLDKQLERSLLLGMVDILFAYAYNKRVTEGEDTVESGWNISKLSATLSWFEEFWSLEQTVRCCFRRCLVFPLHRHWGLCYAVLRDVMQILHLGPRYVLRCLLEIHDTFSRHDSRYILNDLYITDYAVWIQSVRPKSLHRLADALKQVKVRKADLDLDIPELERGAKLAIAEAAAEEASTSDNVSVALQALCISNPLASATSHEGDDVPSPCNTVVKPEDALNALSDEDSTSSDDSSSWSGDESASDSSVDSTSDDSSSDSALDSDDDDAPGAAASVGKRRSGAVADGENASATSSSDSDSDDSDGGSSSEADGGIDQCLLFMKDAEHEKRR